MHMAWWKVVIGGLMVVNGLVFAAQAYLFDDVAAALRIHGDLPPDAGASFVHLKVGRGPSPESPGSSPASAWRRAGGTGPGCVPRVPPRGRPLRGPVLALGSSHPGVWAGFAVFGVLALVYGAACRKAWAVDRRPRRGRRPRAAAAEDGRDRPEEDLQVERERPVVDVGEVELHPLVEVGSSLRPETCQRPVSPGFIESRRRCQRS